MPYLGDSSYYLPYYTPEKFVTLVRVTPLTQNRYDESKFIEDPERPNEPLFFQTEEEGIHWLHQHVRPQKIDSTYRTLTQLAHPDEPVNTSERPLPDVVYRPYIDDHGFVALAKIINQDYSPFVFRRFIPITEGHYYEFQTLDEGIKWLHRWVHVDYISPHYRPLDFTRYFKEGCLPPTPYLNQLNKEEPIRSSANEPI